MISLVSPKTKSKSKRLGRGAGSGKGSHTASRGQKGQKSRTGYKPARRGFEGGTMPLSRRLPKMKGFSMNWKNTLINKFNISLDTLNKNFENGESVNVDTLIEKQIIVVGAKAFDVKILANGKIEKKLTVEGIKTSKKAQEMIESAGGKITEVEL